MFDVFTGIRVLTVSAVMMGRTVTVYPVLIGDGRTAVLVDAGYPGQIGLICDGLTSLQVKPDQISQVIITHQDIDHIGSLSALLDVQTVRAEVLASAFERPYIEGKKRLLKLTPEAVKQAVAALPADTPDVFRQAFRHRLGHPPTAQVNRTIADGDLLSWRHLYQ